MNNYAADRLFEQEAYTDQDQEHWEIEEKCLNMEMRMLEVERAEMMRRC